MAKKRGKNNGTKRKPVKQIQQEAAVKRKAEYADFTKDLDKGLEDPQYPNQRGTVADVCKHFGDETALLSAPSTEESWQGMLVFCVFVGAALIISVLAIV